MTKGWYGQKQRHSMASKGIKSKMKAYGGVGWEIEKNFTDSELLWNKVTFKRLIELINKENFDVLRMDLDENNYGEFYFITLYDKESKQAVTFYGLGFHEPRNRYIINDMHFYITSNYSIDKTDKSLIKGVIIKKLNKIKEEVVEKANRFNEKPNKKFEELAELTDEDFAYAEMYMD